MSAGQTVARRGRHRKDLDEVVNTILSRCVPEGDCLIWTGATGKGSGRIKALGIQEGVMRTHRVVFLHRHGYLPTPPSVVSHTCGNTLCQNIDHMVEETYIENMHRLMRAGHRRGRPRQPTCDKGHEFTPENTTVVHRSNGRDYRRCRKCHNTARLRYYYAVKEGTR